MIGQSNNIPWPDQVKKIRGLADTHEVEDIAQMLHITEDMVKRALVGMVRGKWWIRNTKTKATDTANSSKGAYRKICLLGWAHWEWGIGEVGENVQP